MTDTMDMIVLKSLAPTIAVVMVNVLMVFVLAKTVGEVLTVRDVVLDTVSAAVVTESVLKVNATAILGGLVTPATSVPVCTIAHNTDIATTEPACVKKVTVDAIAHFHLNPNPANVPFTVCVAACNNVPRFTRPKVLAHPTNATLNAQRSVFLNAWLARCLLTQMAPLAFRRIRRMFSMDSKEIEICQCL